MSRGQLHTVLHTLHRLAESEAAKMSDRQLLRRFAQTREESAFAALVERHGSLVMGVCRRTLASTEDAEDVFQATFLILARKAASLRWQSSIASWLYTVALHLATRTRRQSQRRRQQERQAGQMAHAKSSRTEACRELATLLDEQMQRLPKIYRQPLLLCHLEGLSREQAAAQLGWSLRTLERRLTEGRERLRERLSQQGVTLSAALVTAALLAEKGQAAIAPDLLHGTIRAALVFTERGWTAEPTNAKAAVLAQTGLRSLAATRVKLGLLGVLLTGLVLGGGVVAQQAFLPKAREAQSPSPPSLPPRAERKNEGPVVRTDRFGDPLPPGAVARLGTLRFRHEREANGLVFSPDGKILAGACERWIILWEAATGRELRRLPVDSRGTAYSMAIMGHPFDFLPDGKEIVVLAPDNSIGFWDVATGKKRRSFAGPKGYSNAEARLHGSPDGKFMVVAHQQGEPWLVETATGKVVWKLSERKSQITALAFSPDSKRMVVGDTSGSLQLLDVASGKSLRNLPVNEKKQSISSAAFSGDGKRIAAGDWNHIRVVDVETGKRVADFELYLESVNGLAFTPDGRTLLSGSQHGLVCEWDVEAKRLRRKLPNSQRFGRCLALSPDGKTVAVGTAYHVVKLWDVESGKELFTQFTGPESQFYAVVFAPDGRTLYTTEANSRVHAWDTTSWRESAAPAGGRQLALSPDGKRMAWSDGEHKIHVRPLAASDDLWERALTNKNDVLGPLFAGSDAVVTADYTMSPPDPANSNPYGTSRLMIWDAQTGKPRREISLPAFAAQCLCVTPEGRKAFLGGAMRESAILVGDLELGEIAPPLQGHEHHASALAVSPDGRLLASAAFDQSLRLWEVASGTTIHVFPKQPSVMAALAFSPDGRVLATADGSPERFGYEVPDRPRIRFWDVISGREIAHLEGHQAHVWSLAFSPDGKQLASVQGNSTVLIWDVAFLADAVRRKEIDLDATALTGAWNGLKSSEANTAYRAVWSLAAAPRQALPLFQQHLHPVKAIEAARVHRWIAELDSDEFAVREAAIRSLVQADRQVTPALQQALDDKPSLEARRRIEEVRRQLAKNPPSEMLRTLRGIAVLEQIGSPEARKLLQELASGAPAARETRAAKDALQRLR